MSGLQMAIRHRKVRELEPEDVLKLAYALVAESYGAVLDNRADMDRILEQLGYQGGLSEDTYYEMMEEYDASR